MTIDCGFCLSDSGGENEAMPFLEQWRVARKPNRCDECKRPIAPGQRYEFVSGCWDGDWHSYRTCEVCVEIRIAFACSGSWVYSQLWEDIEMNFRSITTACFDKLSTVAAKTYLRERWSQWKGLTDGER